MKVQSAAAPRGRISHLDLRRRREHLFAVVLFFVGDTSMDMVIAVTVSGLFGLAIGFAVHGAYLLTQGGF